MVDQPTCGDECVSQWREGEEPVAALFIPGWSKADNTKCAGVHVIGVLL